MAKPKEKSVPGYYMFPAATEEGVKYDLTIGFYYIKEGGCDCEGALEFHESTYNETSPLGSQLAQFWTLKLYEDCWKFIKRWNRLQVALAAAQVQQERKDFLRTPSLTLAEMEALLVKAGFKRLYTGSQKAEKKRSKKA